MFKDIKGAFFMGRGHKHKTRDKNKASLPQVPKNLKSDGVDEEFSRELADQADLEAQARANAANQRQSTNRRNR
jgi:YfhD-like protein